MVPVSIRPPGSPAPGFPSAAGGGAGVSPFCRSVDGGLIGGCVDRGWDRRSPGPGRDPSGTVERDLVRSREPDPDVDELLPEHRIGRTNEIQPLELDLGHVRRGMPACGSQAVSASTGAYDGRTLPHERDEVDGSSVRPSLTTGAMPAGSGAYEIGWMHVTATDGVVVPTSQNVSLRIGTPSTSRQATKRSA